MRLPVLNSLRQAHDELDEVEGIGVQVIDEEDVKPEASFVDDLNADSLDLVELIMSLEEEFGTEISDEDAEKIRTVQDAVDYIEEHAATSSEPAAAHGAGRRRAGRAPRRSPSTTWACSPGAGPQQLPQRASRRVGALERAPRVPG